MGCPHPSSRKLPFAINGEHRESHSYLKCTVEKPSPYGYVYKTTPAPKAWGHCRRGGGEIVRVRESGSLL